MDVGWSSVVIGVVAGDVVMDCEANVAIADAEVPLSLAASSFFLELIEAHGCSAIDYRDLLHYACHTVVYTNVNALRCAISL